MKLFFSVFLLLFYLSFQAQEQFSVFFDSNKHNIKKTQLTALNQWMTANKDVKIIAINGFCDEDGGIGLNDTLAQKRVNEVFKIVSAKIKTREDFKTRSFGKLHKQSKIKSENRKATIFYILPKDFAREDEILGIEKPKEVVQKPKVTTEELRKKVKFEKEIVIENPNGTRSEFKLDTIFMKKIVNANAGEKLVIENLNFHINTFAIVNESRGKLYELLLVMEMFPRLKIEIHGHICCNPKDLQNLSTQRAKAIASFLWIQGIEKSRVTFKGFGSTLPIYPLPEKTTIEAAANRRVEILIVSND
jgi:outer membrane protein OmpA-like peptidoglycan-associated protein